MKTTLSRAVTIALVTLAAALLGRAYIVEPIYIASASMEPTLTEGTRFFLDKLTFRFRAPRRGEVISFRPRKGGGIESVKRVIAVGGEGDPLLVDARTPRLGRGAIVCTE